MSTGNAGKVTGSLWRRCSEPHTMENESGPIRFERERGRWAPRLVFTGWKFTFTQRKSLHQQTRSVHTTTSQHETWTSTLLLFNPHPTLCYGIWRGHGTIRLPCLPKIKVHGKSCSCLLCRWSKNDVNYVSQLIMEYWSWWNRSYHNYFIYTFSSSW